MFAGPPVLQEHTLVPETTSGAIWRYSAAHPKLFHIHGQIELLVVKRGTARARIGNREYVVHEGQLLWTLPGLPHEHLSASSDLDMRIVHIEPCLVPELTAVCKRVAGRPVVELSRRDFLALLDEADECTITDSAWVDRSRYLPGIARTAIAATERDHDYRAPTSLAELSLALLREDPSLGRRELSRLLDVSGAHLSRCFSAELGTSLQEQRARLRIITFVEHAKCGRHNLLQSALMAGFGTYSQCHRVFGQLAGMSPREYLEQGGRNRQSLIPA